MGLAELALASCCQMEGLMIVGLLIKSGFGGALANGSGAFELCAVFGMLCEKESGLSLESFWWLG